jgi:hypothetical protein
MWVYSGGITHPKPPPRLTPNPFLNYTNILHCQLFIWFVNQEPHGRSLGANITEAGFGVSRGGGLGWVIPPEYTHIFSKENDRRITTVLIFM